MLLTVDHFLSRSDQEGCATNWSSNVSFSAFVLPSTWSDVTALAIAPLCFGGDVSFGFALYCLFHYEIGLIKWRSTITPNTNVFTVIVL